MSGALPTLPPSVARALRRPVVAGLVLLVVYGA
jgi:hypothetical protein